MKRYISLFLTGLILVVSACDSNFEEINTDPNKADGALFDPSLILPTAQKNYSNLTTGYTGAILFQSMWIQALASTSTGNANYYSNGDKYVVSGSTNSYIQSAWNVGYGNASQLSQMQELALTKNKPNLNHVGTIMKVLTLAYVTDIYGDIPYSEAFQATEGITRPTYDQQSSLYPAMLADLDAAITGLNAAQDAITNDVLYAGDLTKWKKFGYSLMLRMAMRLVDADATTAKTYVEKAVAGGVFASIADEAVLASDQTNGYSNSSANALNVVGDVYEVRWSKTMIDFLKSNNDPRLAVVAEVPPAGLINNRNGNISGDNTPALQTGLPNGYDLNGGSTDVSLEPNYPGPTGTGADATPLGNYSRPTAIYRDRDAPNFILTYAEVKFLMAEALIRGYNVGGTSAQHYADGLSAAMSTIAKFNGGVVSAADATAFVATNPLDTSSEAASLKMINEQIWATTSLLADFVEAWNNWKRSGYPVLTPVDYSGNFSQGMIPVRQPYPSSEASTNPDNLKNAISNMGGDTWVNSVWWDAN
ncbi:hypothetical protein GCM10007049_24260 [Echinicola pacifica]|uniref:Starch-binding associating with outer membrane n=1 Tax=Echinicola pacifica TaxID=346377 RepID=A0A918US61_9BACT|nr:SusD/RagB family nutrient-binding outer membrane lipoprotein [Echinicola pacifica]GGZ30585.1 hypothetical protein GCM10007049_24260 [Echinicola pacifica]